MVKLSILAAALLATAGAVIAGPIPLFNAKTKRIAPIYNNATIKTVKTMMNGAPIAGSMNYAGGPIMTGPTNVYYIYYGKGFAATDKTYLETLVAGISAHPYFNSAKTYYGETNGIKTYIKGPVSFTKAIVDNYSLGKMLSDETVQTIVTNHINAGDLPLDVNGVYFVLTAPDVKESSGFCTQYCGWHNNFDLKGNDIKFSFIGNPLTCLEGCAPSNINKSPNGNLGVDAMPSIIIHELVEAMSDPDPASGWTDAAGYENADKCAYVYGNELTDSASGGKYNTQIGKYRYLVQQNWDLKQNGCYNHPVSGGGAGAAPPSNDKGNATTTTTKVPVSSTPAAVPSTSAAVPSTSAADPVPAPSSSGTPACKNGTDKCLEANGVSNYYNECVNGTWVKKDCRKTAGGEYPFCYKYSATDIYCNK